MWIQKNIAHPFKNPGIIFFEHLQEEIDAIVLMREKEDHKILEDLEKLLRRSLEAKADIAGDISQAEVWFQKINDLLLGEKDLAGQRNTEEYRKKMSSKKARDSLSGYIFDLVKQKSEYSDFLQDVIKHFRKTYNNWNKYLFTCYDCALLPNTNLELELFHSRMKRLHRKITSLKKSQRFILIHGEQMSYCSDTDCSYEYFLYLLRAVNYEKVKIRSRIERKKSKQRGENMATLKCISKKLEEAVYKWGK